MVSGSADFPPYNEADDHELMHFVAEGRREALADLFEGAEATDKEILEQVERVIDASGKLERHVAAYLIALRPVLTDEQRTRLYKSCAKGVRQACGLRWRHRARVGGGCGPSGVPTGE